jgi:hypothetical protein
MEDFTSFCNNLKKTQTTPVKPLALDSLTNTSVIPNEYGGIYDRPKKPKISFLQSRLNKDNFWNLMFFVGMNLGFGIAGLIMVLTNNNTLSSIAMWVTILLVPYIVKKNCNITFDKEKLQFLNRNNEVLNDRAPNFFLLLIVTFAGGGFTTFILASLKDFINPSIFPAIFTMVLIFVPTMYCILKNYPIAVYFKKEAYIGDGTARSFSTESYNGHNANNSYKHVGTMSRAHNHSSMSSPRNLYYNPSYRSYSGNIWNNK